MSSSQHVLRRFAITRVTRVSSLATSRQSCASGLRAKSTSSGIRARFGILSIARHRRRVLIFSEMSGGPVFSLAEPLSMPLVGLISEFNPNLELLRI